MALEFSDPDYGAVHHLTVASYLLQHGNRLSAEGWRQMLHLLREFIEDGLEASEARRRHRVVTREERPSLLRGEQRGPSDPAWTVRILDVRREDATQYREDVRRWAAATLREARRLDGSVANR